MGILRAHLYAGESAAIRELVDSVSIFTKASSDFRSKYLRVTNEPGSAGGDPVTDRVIAGFLILGFVIQWLFFGALVLADASAGLIAICTTEAIVAIAAVVIWRRAVQTADYFDVKK